MRKSKRRETGGTRMSNKLFVGIDLGEAESVVTMFSPFGDLMGRVSFSMNDQGYSLFASRVPKHARLGFEACTAAYPTYTTFKALGYDDITSLIRKS